MQRNGQLLGSRSTWPLGALVLSAGMASAQTVGPAFVSKYAAADVGAPPGVPLNVGGIEFKAGDPSMLLVGGPAIDPFASIYEVQVSRDADGHVVGFSGGAAPISTAPDIDGGLAYHPSGVLLYTSWQDNTLGQIEPGSSTPDKVVDLTALGVSVSTGAVVVVPAGFPGAGRVKITSWDANEWYDAQLVPDGNGTFDVVNLALRASGFDGPEGTVYVDPAVYAEFTAPSLLMCTFNDQKVLAFEVDANGDPLGGTSREFLSAVGDEPMGATVDPLTGDFLFSQYNSGHVVVVRELETGSPFCFCDGSGTPAPCGNSGAPTGGCANGSDTAGASLSASGDADTANDSLVLMGARLVPGQPGLYFQGVNATNGGDGLVFGDGLRCVGGSVVRLEVVTADAGGASSTGVSVSTKGGVQPGETRHYQLWYRDPQASPCGAGFNLSNGLTIDWL